MQYTLLELTQDILSSVDGDEVNSISDTVESLQVVSIIKTVYDDILTRGDIKFNDTFFNLEASGEPSKPVLMTKPDSIDKITWIKYNCIEDGDTDPVWTDISYLPLVDFLDMTENLQPSDSVVDTMTLTSDQAFTCTFNFRNDKSPKYYTSFDDSQIIFDAYDSAVSLTLESSKTKCIGSKSSVFTISDTFIPALQPQQFALLLNEAKSLAWAELRQMAHPKAEKTARRNWVHLGKSRAKAGKISDFEKLPSFGRK